jgi:hypothetical protein
MMGNGTTMVVIFVGLLCWGLRYFSYYSYSRNFWSRPNPYSRIPVKVYKGMTICNTNEFVQSRFSDGNLIVRYINKMATNEGGGVVDGVPLRRLQAILVPG